MLTARIISVCYQVWFYVVLGMSPGLCAYRQALYQLNTSSALTWNLLDSLYVSVCLRCIRLRRLWKKVLVGTEGQ